jgi:hypothetical protein
MNPEQPSDANESIAAELSRLARESLEARAEPGHDAAQTARCERVRELAAAGQLQGGRTCFHAAWVMICGETAVDFELAHHLARRATELGEAQAWTLRAMSWDRLLIERGLPQHFGTQIVRRGGRWTLGEIDGRTSDNERALFGVPPRYVLEQRIADLQRRNQQND